MLRGAAETVATRAPVTSMSAVVRDEQDGKMEGDERSCLRRRWKQVTVAIVLVGVISWVVVDAVTQTCMASEGEGDRIQRLFCAGSIDIIEENMVAPGQMFMCGVNGTEVDAAEGWYSDGNSPPTCIRESSCLAVGFSTMLEWIADNPGTGWIATAIIYAVLTVLLIPGSVLTIGSGVAFGTALGLGVGTVVGGTAVIVGATAGAVLAFLMGRFLLREHIEHWAKRFPTIKALDKALQVKGFQLVLLLRLSPIVPFNVFNFIMGSTLCSFSDYFWGSLIGILPGTFAFVFIGALVGSAAFETAMSSNGLTVFPELCEEDPKEATIRLVLFIAGGVATVVAVVLVTIYARRQFAKIKQELALEEGDGAEEGDAAVRPST